MPPAACVCNSVRRARPSPSHSGTGHNACGSARRCHRGAPARWFHGKHHVVQPSCEDESRCLGTSPQWIARERGCQRHRSARQQTGTPHRCLAQSRHRSTRPSPPRSRPDSASKTRPHAKAARPQTRGSGADDAACTSHGAAKSTRSTRLPARLNSGQMSQSLRSDTCRYSTRPDACTWNMSQQPRRRAQCSGDRHPTPPHQIGRHREHFGEGRVVAHKLLVTNVSTQATPSPIV